MPAYDKFRGGLAFYDKNSEISAAHSADASTGAQWPVARCTTFRALKRSANDGAM